MTELEVMLGRHGERIKKLEYDFCGMKKTLQKIHNTLLTIAGGMIVSLILLIINLIEAR